MSKCIVEYDEREYKERQKEKRKQFMMRLAL